MAFRVRADYQNHAIGWLQRIQFPLQWGGGTIVPKLDVIWGMSTQVVIRGISVQTGRRRSDPGADEYLHPSGTPLEKCTHHGPTPSIP